MDLVHKIQDLVCQLPTLTVDEKMVVAKITHREKVIDLSNGRFRMGKGPGDTDIDCTNWWHSSSIITTDTSKERHYKYTKDRYQIQLMQRAGIQIVKNETNRFDYKYPTHFPGILRLRSRNIAKVIFRP